MQQKLLLNEQFKITLLSKTKSKEKEEERQEIYIPPEKEQEIIDDLRLF